MSKEQIEEMARKNGSRHLVYDGAKMKGGAE